MMIPLPSSEPLGGAANTEDDKIDIATVVGGTAVGVVGGAVVVASVVRLISNLRPLKQGSQNDSDRARNKEPSDEELRQRAPSLSSPDDVEELRRQNRSGSSDLPAPPVGADVALFAFRSGDVDEIRRILAEHGAVYEIIRAPQ